MASHLKFLAVISALVGFANPLTPSLWAQNVPVTIMPLGDSGTAGTDYYTGTIGGYRDPLYKDLIASGVTNFLFVGVNNAGSASRSLTDANEANNNGFGGYKIADISNNLDAGGYWITGGGGTGRAPNHPDIILLEIGANDIIQGASLTDIETGLNNLVQKLHTLTPNSVIFVAAIYPFNYAPTSTQNTEIQAYDSYIQNTLVPSLSYTRYVDNHTDFFNADGTVNSLLLGTDDIHPTRYGYPVWAENWMPALRTYFGVSPTNQTLTVSGGTVVNTGTTTGSYPAGSVITINSNAPAAGSQFGSWSASTATTALSNPFYQITTYIVPATNATVTANDVPTGSSIIPDGTYNVVAGSDEYQMSYSTGPNGLSMSATSAQGGSAVQQQTYTGAATQQWVLKNLNPGNNVVELSLPSTSLAMEVSGASTASNAPLDVATYTGSTSQQWTITPLFGTTELVNVNSGLAAAYGYSMSSGSALFQDAAGYQTYQNWTFYPISALPPAPPTNLTATAGSGQVSLSWTPSPNSTSYSVYRGTFTGGLNNMSIIASNLTSTTYVDKALIGPPASPVGVIATGGSGQVTLQWSATNPNTTYFYEVVAVGASGLISGGSNDASAAPTGGPVVSSYSIYRGTSSYQESGTPIAAGVASITYTDSAVTSGTPYFYYITATSVTGSSSGSAQVTATPTAVTAPSLVSAVSRQTQGSTGAYDFNLPLTGTPAVEDRASATAGSYSIVLTFSQAVTSLTPSLAIQAGHTGTAVGTVGTPVINGTTVTIPLTGVGNAQRLNVHLANIQPGGGSADVPINILIGDVNGDGAVSSLDIPPISAAYGTTGGQSKFNPRADVNCDGAVSSVDLVPVKTYYGTQLH
jgi:lysophospholipase L1-like esterase